MKKIIIALAVLAAVLSCTKITSITDSITNPSARDIYKREAKSDLNYDAWELAYKTSTNDSLTVELPYLEKGTFHPKHFASYSYTIKMQEGEMLVAEVARDSMHHKVFIDIFESTATGYRHIADLNPGAEKLEYTIESPGNYKVVIQPELAANTNFYINLFKKATYGFPVAGKGNSAIQSFWGYERDGGKRKHEGVDIFANRGTPVVAVADGYITDTGDRGLGGKQVWQRAGSFGNAIYYAHLDEIAAVAGTAVKTGDTLGFVGNTGNAKGGPPHLHFGIYRNGAVDPLPFIFNPPKADTPKLSALRKSFNSTTLKIKSATANLRQSPSTKGISIGSLAKNDVFTYLGEHKEWLHIKTVAGQKAFLHKSLATVVN